MSLWSFLAKAFNICCTSWWLFHFEASTVWALVCMLLGRPGCSRSFLKRPSSFPKASRRLRQQSKLSGVLGVVKLLQVALSQQEKASRRVACPARERRRWRRRLLIRQPMLPRRRPAALRQEVLRAQAAQEALSVALLLLKFGERHRAPGRSFLATS